LTPNATGHEYSLREIVINTTINELGKMLDEPRIRERLHRVICEVPEFWMDITYALMFHNQAADNETASSESEGQLSRTENYGEVGGRRDSESSDYGTNPGNQGGEMGLRCGGGQ
jgi:hypothetical protein